MQWRCFNVHSSFMQQHSQVQMGQRQAARSASFCPCEKKKLCQLNLCKLLRVFVCVCLFVYCISFAPVLLLVCMWVGVGVGVMYVFCPCRGHAKSFDKLQQTCVLCKVHSTNLCSMQGSLTHGIHTHTHVAPGSSWECRGGGTSTFRKTSDHSAA